MTEVLRWVRALTLACLLLLTGVGGHVAADGAAPAAAWLAGLLVLATVVVAPALGAPASSGRVALLLVAGQLLLHVTLALAAAPAGNAGTAAGAMQHASMAGSPMAHGHAASAGVMPALTSGAHLGMVMAHLAAALVVALWLAAGERAVWTLLAVAAGPLVEALSRTLQAACAGALLVVGAVRDLRPRHGHGSGLPVRSDAWLACGVSRRGPPSAVVA